MKVKYYKITVLLSLGLFFLIASHDLYDYSVTYENKFIDKFPPGSYDLSCYWLSRAAYAQHAVMATIGVIAIIWAVVLLVKNRRD